MLAAPGRTAPTQQRAGEVGAATRRSASGEVKQQRPVLPDAVLGGEPAVVALVHLPCRRVVG